MEGGEHEAGIDPVQAAQDRPGRRLEDAPEDQLLREPGGDADDDGRDHAASYPGQRTKRGRLEDRVFDEAQQHGDRDHRHLHARPTPHQADVSPREAGGPDHEHGAQHHRDAREQIAIGGLDRRKRQAEADDPNGRDDDDRQEEWRQAVVALLSFGVPLEDRHVQRRQRDDPPWSVKTVTGFPYVTTISAMVISTK